MTQTEQQAIADEELMQAAMAQAHARTGSVVLDEYTTDDGVVVQTVPFVAVTDADIEAAAADLRRRQ